MSVHHTNQQLYPYNLSSNEICTEFHFAVLTFLFSFLLDPFAINAFTHKHLYSHTFFYTHTYTQALRHTHTHTHTHVYNRVSRGSLLGGTVYAVKYAGTAVTHTSAPTAALPLSLAHTHTHTHMTTT